MSEIKESLKDTVERMSKDTVGFSEAKDKESFMTGVDVAFSLFSRAYDARIEALEQQLKQYKNMYDEVHGDLLCSFEQNP